MVKKRGVDSSMTAKDTELKSFMEKARVQSAICARTWLFLVPEQVNRDLATQQDEPSLSGVVPKLAT